MYDAGVMGDSVGPPFLLAGEAGTDMVIDMGVIDSVRGVCATEDDDVAGDTLRS